MVPARARVLGALAAVVLVLGGVVVLTRDDGGDEDASELETEDDTTTSRRRESTSTSDEAEDTTSTTKASTTTTAGGKASGGGSGSPPSSSATDAPATPTTRPPDPFASARIKLTRVVSLDYPIAMAVRPSDGSLWVARKAGAVCRLSGTSCTNSQAVASVSTGNEQGLLGIAFNPTGTRFYASYTNPAGDSRLDELPMSGNTIVTGQKREIFAEDQPEPNHNGGNIVFGPDGRLYLGLGDGGGAGDQHGGNGNGQNPNTDLGKILRINPANPPTVQRFISGVRNPWRFSFDRANGSLWIADVGQNTWEEVSYLPAGSQQGRNLGWRCYEGNHRYSSCTPSPGHTAPIYEYHQDPGCSITGGYVYRGSKIPNLAGAYLFSDYCDGQIRGFTISGGKVRTVRGLGVDPGNVVSFGQAANGDLYVLTPSAVWRIDPA